MNLSYRRPLVNLKLDACLNGRELDLYPGVPLDPVHAKDQLAADVLLLRIAADHVSGPAGCSGDLSRITIVISTTEVGVSYPPVDEIDPAKVKAEIEPYLVRGTRSLLVETQAENGLAWADYISRFSKAGCAVFNLFSPRLYLLRSFGRH